MVGRAAGGKRKLRGGDAEDMAAATSPGGKRASPSRYNDYKEDAGGNVYTGMKVGGRHIWDYGAGEWRETKETADRWRIQYQVTKRRRGHAPPGSGVPIGTEYHWMIVAHQYVKKVDDNTYETNMEGLKYKLAHKRAGHDEWSIPTEHRRRTREVRILQDAIDRVEAQEAPGGTETHGRRRGRATSPLLKGQRTLEEMLGVHKPKPADQAQTTTDANDDVTTPSDLDEDEPDQ
ncbi:unnamed protein product (mitochondrion) [Plasmodiophora brassicae]|uniref:Uncharacterized protein n=1 Tax=Plasmodiophora brassicae TaxID=37360 RepID=A0A0G4IGX2_PLABS|nr:hypothetical protein PBRA_000251 [Plasmodiophora brassicae]SPQ96813.1 unnamed protein product [Plasmodiophora brassicae]